MFWCSALPFVPFLSSYVVQGSWGKAFPIDISRLRHVLWSSLEHCPFPVSKTGMDVGVCMCVCQSASIRTFSKSKVTVSTRVWRGSFFSFPSVFKQSWICVGILRTELFLFTYLSVYVFSDCFIFCYFFLLFFSHFSIFLSISPSIVSISLFHSFSLSAILSFFPTFQFLFIYLPV